jgi:hypothetical protein
MRTRKWLHGNTLSADDMNSFKRGCSAPYVTTKLVLGNHSAFGNDALRACRDNPRKPGCVLESQRVGEFRET